VRPAGDINSGCFLNVEDLKRLGKLFEVLERPS